MLPPSSIVSQVYINTAEVSVSIIIIFPKKTSFQMSMSYFHRGTLGEAQNNRLYHDNRGKRQMKLRNIRERQRRSGERGKHPLSQFWSFAQGKDYYPGSLPSNWLTDSQGSRKQIFLWQGFILVSLWQKAGDDKDGFKAIKPLSTGNQLQSL